MAVDDDPRLARAAPARLAAFLAGRFCAARALAVAGLARSCPIPIGRDGAPGWPAGAVGSLSHSADRAIAVAACAADWLALGVDCEAVVSRAQADEVAALILTPDEVDAAAGGLGTLDRPTLVTVAFSAKESLYKALRPLVGAWFGFSDAALVKVTAVGGSQGRARLRLTRALEPGPAGIPIARGAEFDVRYAVDDDHAYTCLAVPRFPPGAPR